MSSAVPRKQSFKNPDAHGSQNAFKDIFLLKVKKSYQIDSSKKSDSKKLNSGILVRKRLKAKGAVYMNIQIKNNTGGGNQTQKIICWVQFLI